MEKKLDLAKRLPEVEEFSKIAIDSKDEIISECISLQNFPYTRWRTHDLEKYLNHQWVPIPWVHDKVYNNLPFGYKKDPEKAKEWGLDPGSILFPIPDQLFALEEARILVKKYTYASVAEWLTHKTGRKIGARGLLRRLEGEKRQRERAETYKRWAIRISKALIAAAKIEEEHPGAKVPWARAKNFYNNPNYDRRGKFSGKKVRENLGNLFRLADPRPYIKNLWKEIEEEKRAKRAYPPPVDDELSRYRPAREHVSSTEC